MPFTPAHNFRKSQVSQESSVSDKAWAYFEEIILKYTVDAEYKSEFVRTKILTMPRPYGRTKSLVFLHEIIPVEMIFCQHGEYCWPGAGRQQAQCWVPMRFQPFMI